MTETIFALSSGSPPAAIGVIRVSGPHARAALANIAGQVPEPRRAVLRVLRDASAGVLDQALVWWTPGPGSATGEDLVELHCHGSRAVIAAIESALAAIPGLRPAVAGEFTQRAFVNGRIDLAEAEGLADLLTAETELQRCCALAMAGGALSRAVDRWRECLLGLSASIEAMLDFSDDDDAVSLPPTFDAQLQAFAAEIDAWLSRPRAETLREGIRVVLAGPPNSGKSTLFNALLGHEAAITAASAGTTRDVLARGVALDGVPFTLVDTAGLHEAAHDAIEIIGIARARAQLDTADLVLWLGPEGEGPRGAWEIEAQVDRELRVVKHHPRHRVSALTRMGLDPLQRDLVASARTTLPSPGEAALSERQHGLLQNAQTALALAGEVRDALLVAEELRVARTVFDALTGAAATDDMLSALFRRFCIGK